MTAVTITPVPARTPLPALLHDTAFHLPGKHDQSAHGGRGGAASTTDDAALARRLNEGKSLRASEPDEARLIGAIAGWTGADYARNPAHRPTAEEITEQIQAAYDDPTADTSGARLLRAAAAAPPVDYELHRGMAAVPARDIPRSGDTVTLGLSSFSSRADIAESFSKPLYPDQPATSVRMTVRPGSRALSIEKHAGDYGYQREHLAVGRYRVHERRETRETRKVYDRERRVYQDLDYLVVHLDVEQVE